MEIARYTHIRNELIRLYKMFTEEHFVVILPMSSFMTLTQLEHLKDNPPITGFETLELPVERPYSIARILKAFDIMGDSIQIGFRYPSKDIPRIYDAVQDWIRYWIEIKREAGYMRTPDIGELELIERLARYIFTAYSHYHYSKIYDTLNVRASGELTLLDVVRGRMMYGTDLDEPLSYISYLDEWKSTSGYVSANQTHGAYNWNGFGGGM